MEYSVNTDRKWQTTVSVALAPEDIKEHYDKAIKKIQKDVTLEGFRKGKVPPQLIKRLYGDQIESEANQFAIEHAWKTIFKESDFYVINEPDITNLNPTDSGGMTFDITFEIHPDFTVEGYEDISVEKVIYEVTEEDVDEAIDLIRQQNAMMYTVDDEAAAGHFIYADLQEVDATGVPVIGQKIENQQIWLTEDDEELTPQLIGVKAGDERKISLMVTIEQSDFIEQPGMPDEIRKFYRVRIKEVKERRLPDLDDEFAKDVGPYETMDELKEQYIKNLRHRAEHDTQHAFENALTEALIDNMDFEIPDSMLNFYLDNVIKNAKKRNKNSAKPFDEQHYRAMYQSHAIRDLKWHLISEQLQKQENFQVTDADIEAKLDHYREHGEDGTKRAEAIRNNHQELERLRESIIFDKLYAFLADKVNVTEMTKPWRELQEPAPEENGAAQVAE
ncbi:trigger factor [candidate division KSB1 bacterium]|nr:trigger factor [candidate division KSB1 bacterium]